MNKIFGAIVGMFEKMLELLHISDVVNNEKVQRLIKTGIKAAVIIHPEYKDPIVEISSKVILGIDGSYIPNTDSLTALIEKEVEGSSLKVEEKAALLGIIYGYNDVIAQVFDNEKITEELAKLKELRALAVVFNNAAGGSAV